MVKASALFVFIDESGNFDFTPSGTKYWVLTAVTTRAPMKGREELIQLRYDLLAKGINQESFHATEDSQEVRDRVYEVLGRLDDYLFIPSSSKRTKLILRYTSVGVGRERQNIEAKISTAWSRGLC